MWLRRLIRVIGLFSVLFVVVCFFPAIGDIFSVIYYKDIYINYDKYNKKYILIDSLTYMNTDGNNADRVDGYSKELNNYKTIILLGKIRNDNDIAMEGMDSNGNVHRYVWYRNGIDFAYPGNKEEKEFPIEKFIYKRAQIPLLWLFAVFVSFVMYKISMKSKLFKQLDQHKNEKKNHN